MSSSLDSKFANIQPDNKKKRKEISDMFLILCLHQEIAEDEENVRKVSSYLTNVVLPKFIQDLCTLEVSPMDGQTLTEALHAHGINVRYIGKVSVCECLNISI